MRRATAAAVALAAAALALLPAAAAAHVTVQPSSAPAGGFARLDVRVPNERADAGTVKVDVQLPPGVIAASYEPVPGWTVRLARERLDTPVETEDGFEVDEQIARITWTGRGPDGVIPPGAFRDFGLSLRMPAGEPGDVVTFKALQTYDDGEVVRWIGPEDADEPAPTVTLEAAAEGGGHGAPGTAAEGGEDAAAPAASTTAPAADEGTDALTIVALVLGALGLAAGIAALLTARRTSTRTR
jgi:uncharacterized protein YcnI